MNKYDKSWSDLNRPKPISLQPIGVIGKQNPLTRVLRAIKLRITTRYNWRLSWIQAAK